ncbi:gliding motility-associated C-terminal domain-containing protein [Neolewinella agarilytica]|uniref:T9SS type B sorting domain-containing protein n=1 Tax=Neolewinella agarilytica TaxID=478744 RepID=UPI00235642C9|nr:gliding motility-associated C-terminal domain-containing protein [Neolewinella agarilytica]
MVLRLFCFLMVLSLSCSLAGQCGVTVDAGADLSVCAGGGSIRLLGDVFGTNVVGFAWTPAQGLSDATDLEPTAMVTGPAVYTLTALVFDLANNIITNGDFEAGDSGFSTDYSPGSGGSFGLLSDEGEYVITTNSNLTHTNFSNCPDHSGSGNMMVVNGSSTLNENVWCQTVSVDPNTTYVFNAWLQSVHPQNPARLQFSVNGDLVGDNFRASGSTCDWREFDEVWQSGGSNSAEICITNQNTQGSGNDFAIDDIFFGPVCEQSDEVEIFEVSVEADAPATLSLPCDVPPQGVVIDGTNSSDGANYFYNWTTADGNLLSGANGPAPRINAASTYELEVTYDDGVTFCTDQTTVLVTESTDIPDAAADRLNDIDCNNPTAILTAVGSSSGSNIRYEWTTTDGNILSGANGASPEVDAQGTYQLTVIHQPSGCRATASVMVTAEETMPLARIALPDELSCDSPSIQLDGSGSAMASNIAAVWTTPNGNFESGTDGLMPIVNLPGNYTLTLTNTTTGCEASATVRVNETPSDLVADAVVNDTLNCRQRSVRLSVGASSIGGPILYQWTTDTGNIVSGANGGSPLVDAPGQYFLLVSDGASGCSARDTVEVISRVETVNIAVPEAPPFTCGSAQMTLSSSGNSVFGPLQFTWTASNGGTIVSDGNTDSPTVAGAGSYTLTVTNPQNGCSADSMIVVAENTLPPLADAGPDFTLTCASLQDTLRGGAPQTNAVYRWTTSGGNFLADSTSPRPVINAQGTYYLMVTDTSNACVSRDTVNISENAAAPRVRIATPERLDCRRTELTLDGSNSDDDPGFAIRWTTTDGNLLNGENSLQARVDAAGTYTLTILNQNNDCSTELDVVVVQDTVMPGADAGAGGRLDCRAPTLQLLPDTTGGSGFDYAWTDAAGLGFNSLMPSVIDSGTYYFRAENPDNGCFAIDSVKVTADFTAPVAVTGPETRQLTCRTRQVLLGNPEAINPNLEYRWTTPNGQFMGPDFLSTLPVSFAGTYRLTTTSRGNGCSADGEVLVTADRELPRVRLALPEALDCERSELSLQADSVADSLLIRWSTPDGNFLSGTDGPSPVVDRPGQYQLRLENPANGCTDSTTVRVRIDTIAPLAAITPPGALDCRTPQRELLATSSSQGSEFAYAWSSADGNIVSGSETLMPVVAEAGTYLLTVRNTVNGCQATDSVIVQRDAAPPQLSFLPPDLLTCTRTSVDIVASLDEPNADEFLLFWTDDSGNFLQGGSTLTPTVTAPGRYRLTASNRSTGCRAVLSVRVNRNVTPPAVSAGPDIDLGCERKPMELSAEATGLGPFTYAWTTADGRIIRDENSARPLSDGPGTYTVTVTDQGNGCVGGDTVVTIQDLPETFAFSQVPPDCRVPTGTVVFESVSGGTAPFLYSVNGGASFQSDTLATGLESGDYRLVVQDAKGCEIRQQTNIPFPPELDVFLDARAFISLGDSFRLNTVTNFADSAFAIVNWTPTTALSCEDCLRPNASPSETTIYTLSVETTDGCRASDQLELIVDRSLNVYFPTAFSPDGDGVNDRWVPFANSTLVRNIPSLRIYDRWGNAVFFAENLAPNDAASGWDGTLRGKGMNPAVFVFTTEIEFVDGRVEVFEGEIVLVR